MDFICPACGRDLGVSGEETPIKCGGCGQAYPVESGIPLLFVPTNWETGSKRDVTNEIKAFYEQTPFPNYEGTDTSEKLREKAERGLFARMLDQEVPVGGKVLEAGCGTGQVSNYLGMTWGRTVYGSDMCLNSLKLGQGFKQKNSVKGTRFVQMNLFKPVFKPGTFDIVICNGVLHHTGDPERGFASIAKLVKPGGHIVIGLYHRYGRILTDLRRKIFNMTGNRFKFLDWRLRNKSVGDLRKHTWFMDQYKNPHESKHTFGDLISWFDRAGFEYVNGIPKPEAFSRFSEGEKLFEPHSQGSALDHFLVQLRMLLLPDREGGFFVMIGRKKP